ncbi:hypothetical protein V8G54_013092, partial [Vigna mungo]
MSYAKSSTIEYSNLFSFCSISRKLIIFLFCSFFFKTHASLPTIKRFIIVQHCIFLQLSIVIAFSIFCFLSLFFLSFCIISLLFPLSQSSYIIFPLLSQEFDSLFT